MKKTFLIAAALIILCNINALAKDKKKKDNNQTIKFTTVCSVPTTAVKDQNKSGTCWSFAATSFIETEALRITGKTFDISEMYFVREAYLSKVKKNIRLHGKSNLGPGGQAHDVTNVLRNFGALPENIYPGLNYGIEQHNHNELDAMVRGMTQAVLKGRKPTTAWYPSISSMLDIYLGEVPMNFSYNNKNHTSQSFVKDELKLNADDYIELTSYSAYPFYNAVNLEVPDNWSNDLYYNLPLEELYQTIVHALQNGYSVCWDGDVSDKGFNFKKGVAIVPEKEWKKYDDDEISELFETPNTELEISDELRLERFNNFDATDDHLMHIIGIEEDKNEKFYFKTKNSWNNDSNDFGGYLNMSESFLKLRTVAVMIHKDAIPKEVAEKLGL